MIHCPSCSTSNDESSKYCSECGAALKPEYTPTVTHRASANEDGVHSSPSGSSHHGRFLPGSKVADRYRIVSLVGKGGMGEVFRADDLKLGHTVALKFLPKVWADSPNRLEYFHSEVRLTRQISHPNVCRVYDIGEFDGQHFLSMEYIDGEDLKVLLRRIGRLPSDKGAEIAQQLCSGLAAAHDKGVLHRDLKPANIMIDSRGQVRITDFGLARLSEDTLSREVAGTPAYMAPEQLARGEATIQSDLYSLGLVLYELFTGKAVCKETSIPEILRLHEESTPSHPSQLIDDMDPVVERVILRCLEKEPHERPRSAHAVAAALPGRNPLAAALAAGETPTPEMVAAAGGSGAVSLRTAVACLAAIVVGLLLYVPIAGQLSPSRDFKDGVDFYAKDARDILQEQGHFDPQSPPAHVVYGFHGNTIGEFWYRQSPTPMTPHEISLRGLPSPNVVTLDNPPLNVEHMVSLRLDAGGRLQEFAVVPRVDRSGNPATNSIDWGGSMRPKLDKVFQRAGLRLEDYGEPQPPRRNPPFYADAVWEFSAPFKDSSINRVEVAAVNGRITYFRVMRQDSVADILASRELRNLRLRWSGWVNLSLAIALAAMLLAWFNASRGRCDWTGAGRVGFAVFTLDFASSLLAVDHLLMHPQHEVSQMWTALIGASSRGVRWWMYYLAMEPFARRLWPNMLTSWSRAMSGRFRDPLLGRDILVGATVAVVTSVVMVAVLFVGTHWAGAPIPTLPGLRVDLANLSGARHMFSSVFRWFEVGVSAVYWAFWLVLLRSLLRVEWLAVIAFLSIIWLSLVEIYVPLSYVNLLHFARIAILLTRFGVVTAASYMFCQFVLWHMPITADLAGPDVATSAFAVAVTLAWAGYGLFVSLGRGPQRLLISSRP